MKLTAVSLHRLLASVLPAADTNREMKMLNAIYLHATGDELHAYATNRYVAAASWERLDKPVKGTISALISLSDAKQLIKITKPSTPSATQESTPVRLIPSTDGQSLTVEFERAATTLTLVDSQYPNIQAMFVHSYSCEPAHTTRFDPRYIAPVVSAAKAVKAKYIKFAVADKMTRAHLGDNALWLIIPRRPDEDDNNDAEWIARLTPRATAPSALTDASDAA